MRVGFALALLASQWVSGRDTVLTAHLALVVLGGVLVVAGMALWIAASLHLRRAQRASSLATRGPYRYVRHPIYLSVYLLSIGLGLMFFAWLWFLVLLVFAPLWWLECRDEEREMAARHGDAWAAYQAGTAMLIPGIY
jgi:protein-S-isoprenylcysteine O-methyltransferase Ste14